MKIALCNRDPRSHVGGDAIQVYAYIKALEGMGHEAKYFWELDPDLRGYDEAWLFHINFGWTLRQWRKVKEANLPYKVFAIYYPNIYSDINHEQMEEILKGAKQVYCLSTEEAGELSTEFPGHFPEIVDNGVDKTIFKPQGEKIEGNYLLSVGRVEESKGHIYMVELANKLGMDSFVIGPIWDNRYKNTLMTMGATVLESISQEELAKYYRGAKCYICGSGGERNSLTVLEAAACGIPVLNSMHNRGKEWLSAPIITFKDLPSIVEMTKEAIANPKDLSKEVPSWKDIVEQILKT